MANYIIFPIGDWSCDGHNCYADFLVKSDKNLTEVRETHFKENKFIGSLCKEYDDNKIQVDELYEFLSQYIGEDAAKQKLQEFIADGFELGDEDETDNVTLSFDQGDEASPQHFTIFQPEEMLKIWITILNAINPSLNLEIASEAMSSYYIKYKGYPHKPDGDINFYGYDDKQRHLETPGYGIWSDYCGEFDHSC